MKKQIVEDFLTLPTFVIKDVLSGFKKYEVTSFNDVDFKIDWSFRDGRSSKGLGLSASISRDDEADEAWLEIEQAGGYTNSQIIEAVYTVPHFGGFRWFWVCPDCKAKRSHLHTRDGKFSCRVCMGLTYESTRDMNYDSVTRKMRKICHKLGHTKGLLLINPKKPKGMHRTTFNSLLRDYARQEMILFGIIDDRCANGRIYGYG